MFETPIHSSFVSQVAEIGFADGADALEGLAGSRIGTGPVRLEVGERIGTGLAGAVWYSGVLRTGSLLIPSVKVDVVLSPWSAGRTEVGIRPLTRLGRFDSLRATRFFNAAWPVLGQLTARLGATPPVKVPTPAGVRVAA